MDIKLAKTNIREQVGGSLLTSIYQWAEPWHQQLVKHLVCQR